MLKAMVEAVGDDEGHRSHLLVDHARLVVETSTPGKTVELRKVLDEWQPGRELRLLLRGYAPREERLESFLKWAPENVAEAHQCCIVDACPLLGGGLMLECYLVAMSCTKRWDMSAARLALATCGSQGPASFVGECSGGSPFTINLSAKMFVRRFPSAIKDAMLLTDGLPDMKALCGPHSSLNHFRTAH